MDGLPLLGAEPDAFGILQTPPLDLERAEVIKGAASALYGASALAGVLNLKSRVPNSDSSVLASVDSNGGRQASAFLTAPGAGWSGTLMASVDSQSRKDVDSDGWTDLPFHRRFTFRPRLWWNPAQDQSLFVTAGIMDEDRRGGTTPSAALPEGYPFSESLHTQRFDAGAVSHSDIESGSLDGHFSFTWVHKDSTFGPLRANPILRTGYAEEAWSDRVHGHILVLGVAFQHDDLSEGSLRGVGYNYNVPAFFAQDEFAPKDWLTIAGSVRVDIHNRYGTFVSPHLSALLHGDGPWSLRASVARGFSAPTPQVEEIESTSLAALLPIRNLHAERATSSSLDLRRASGGWEVNASIFISEVRGPIDAVRVGNLFELLNGPGSRRVPGEEVVVLYRRGSLESIASWTHLHVTQTPEAGVPALVPLVPINSARLGTILKLKGRGRVGLEVEYTGPQSLEGDPYRNESPGFVELNALTEIRLGRLRVFANALNLTNVRQSHWDPLLRPTPGPGGNPITDAWAPLVGRTFNAGIRADL